MNQNRRKSPGTFPIVAIGASAGGLEALEQFLEQVTAASGMAFVVVQHLDPDHKGMLPELLQNATGMQVLQARNRQRVKPDHVYVIPPNRDLSILRGCLYVHEPVAPRGMRLPIDSFFRTLADDCRENAIGVILSGMGSDGALGLRAIKEQGGLILVQEPASAKFDSMPRSAIDTGLADIVAPAAKLPQLIVDTLRHAPSAQAGAVPPDDETEPQGSALDQICTLLQGRTGHDFSSYKKSTLYRRIERRMAIHELKTIADYVLFLGQNPQESDLLFKELLIGVTNFFRDPSVWAYLAEKALPELLSRHPKGSALRAWVAGCSTGEEAYSLAITFRETLERLKLQGHYSLKIFATDLDPDAIERARQGYFPANIAVDLSKERLQRFFVQAGKGYRVGKEIREMVVFAPQNVIMDPPFTKLDILTCRNVLIYFSQELQKKLLPLFYYSLNPGGILMLGSAETVGGLTDRFTSIGKKTCLFLRNAGPLRIQDLDFPTRHFPNHPESSMDKKNNAPIVNLQSIADQLLLREFSPAAVLVDANGDLVYINGRTGKYLEPAMGKVNWNIHAMAREGLAHALALALPNALSSGEVVTCRNLHVNADAGPIVVDLTVHPIKEPASLRGMAMVVFTDVATPTEAGTSKRSGTRRKLEVERALAQAHMEMRSLRDEMQISHEELKSTNEELQSTNEELQSANEELTTSKEEMQSLNEELQTVNSELQSKLEALSSANNDMTNLLNSTNIATVFLDQLLRVRRFTNLATELFKLIPGDVGRPLSDIVSNLDYPSLSDDADNVLRTLAISEREVATHDGRWYQIKIMPYRTLENIIDGVVITCTDITRAKSLEAELRAAGVRSG